MDDTTTVTTAGECIVLRALALLVETGRHMTRGEIRTALGLPSDIEITARIREARRLKVYGRVQIATERLRVTRFKRGKLKRTTEYRYYVPDNEMDKAREVLAKRGVA